MAEGADSYDPLQFARGVVRPPDSDEGTDKCGRSSRGHPPFLRLATRQGVFWIPYHGIVGLDEFKDRFVIHFRATLGWEERPMEGCWQATVTGMRLAGILNHLGSGQRTALNEGGTPRGTEPCVSRIEMEPVLPAEFEA